MQGFEAVFRHYRAMTSNSRKPFEMATRPSSSLGGKFQHGDGEITTTTAAYDIPNIRVRSNLAASRAVSLSFHTRRAVSAYQAVQTIRSRRILRIVIYFLVVFFRFVKVF